MANALRFAWTKWKIGLVENWDDRCGIARSLSSDHVLRISQDSPASPVVGEDLELDLLAYEPRRAGRVLKLERVPMELLLLFE
jgi:hypothetical protein